MVGCGVRWLDRSKDFRRSIADRRRRNPATGTSLVCNVRLMPRTGWADYSDRHDAGPTFRAMIHRPQRDRGLRRLRSARHPNNSSRRRKQAKITCCLPDGRDAASAPTPSVAQRH